MRNPSPVKIAARFLNRRATSGLAVAPSAEEHFFDNPQKREPREFAESKAISNNKDIAVQAIPVLDLPKRQELKRVRESPPTPTQNLEQPGSKDFSTLSRFVVETEQPTSPGVPQGHDEVPKHPDLKKEAQVLPEVRELLSGWFK